MSLSNGVLPTEKIVNDLTAVEKGQTAVNAFIEDRLVKQTTGFYWPELSTRHSVPLYLWRQLLPDHLFSTLEKADTRLLLHAHDASLKYQDVIIHTPDTDVFIFTITMWVIEARIFIKTGKQNNLRLIDVEKNG